MICYAASTKTINIPEREEVVELILVDSSGRNELINLKKMVVKIALFTTNRQLSLYMVYVLKPHSVSGPYTVGIQRILLIFL